MSGLISIQSPSQWQDVLNSTNVVVADFYADWCGPCKAIAPHFEKMANEYSKPKKAAFCKINVDTQSTISRAHGVSAMPTFIIFHAGKPIETIRGANPPALANAVANAMKLPDKTKAGGASFGTPGRTLGGQGVGAAAGSGGLPPSRPYNSGFDVVSILRHLFTIAALYVVTLVAIDPLQAAEKSSFNLVNPPAREAARGAGPGGKTRAPPARPSAFRTLADLGKDDLSSKTATHHAGSGLVQIAQSCPADIEQIVQEAKQRFRDTLPKGYLNEEEYSHYVRLFGPPLRETTPEDVGIPYGKFAAKPKPRQDQDGPVLLRQAADGDLEEVDYSTERHSAEEAALLDGEVEHEHELTDDQHDYINATARNQREYDALVMLQKDFEAARLRSQKEEEASQAEFERRTAAEAGKDEHAEALEQLRQEDRRLRDERTEESRAALAEMQAASRAAEAQAREEAGDWDDREFIGVRTHPYTQEGRFATSPKTLPLPSAAFNDPITQLLDRTHVKHIRMAAEAALGGGGLPNSPATPASKRSVPQLGVGLQAAQPKMSQIDADAFIATVLPPSYASAMSTLTEVRKRLGTEWIRKLLKQEGGPRILDAGSGGASLAAWQDVAQAEWDVMRESKEVRGWVPPGKKTVIVGSDTLRHRVSTFLDNTTFLPRLPDYVHSHDNVHKHIDAPQVPQQRKLYDVIVASYVLLGVKEGHRRTAVLNQLWSLLSPEGGVLIFIEKAHPRGFEAVADVRDRLINEYLQTPVDSTEAPTITDAKDAGYRAPKEPGMIVAPCTNHKTCPMYARFTRPRFLQQILEAKHRNDDDVQFSYVAIQRGGTPAANLLVGHEATERAFAGYEDATRAPNMLSLPRQILPPLKRKGHVQLEAYHDARKAAWGDLWALGAKVRAERAKARAKASKKVDKINMEYDETGVTGIKEGGRTAMQALLGED
ncbi:Thioredoxin like protein [Verticillium longisporum]|uniref:Thioredoxin like protein n=1 Tax=Verticillium longisporum TaxID=100787 RepID=A0A8I3ATY9_VERLO|nr:Thioredoxin like protein [Verticillium longisporum]